MKAASVRDSHQPTHNYQIAFRLPDIYNCTDKTQTRQRINKPQQTNVTIKTEQNKTNTHWTGWKTRGRKWYKTKKSEGISAEHVTRACASTGREHAVPKESVYKKSLRERCAKGSCPGARRGLWLEGLEAAEGYYRKRQRKREDQTSQRSQNRDWRSDQISSEKLWRAKKKKG